MKKTLVSALTSALVVGATATTFAAANPFSDVPADHWAYDAVAQLARDGVIEGYGDGTYRGEQEITRYEMAQMIARALGKIDVATPEPDRAMLDKLAAEFADELNNLGVRVERLEKKMDNVKWGGSFEYEFKSKRPDVGKKENTNNYTFKLEPTMTVNDNWTVNAEIEFSKDNNAKDAVSVAKGAELKQAFAEGDYDNFNLKLGRLGYTSNIDGGMVMDTQLSGAQVAFGKSVQAVVTAGRLLEDDSATSNYQAIELVSDPEKKFTWGLGYHNVSNDTYSEILDHVSRDSDKRSIVEIGLGMKLSDSLALSGAYAEETGLKYTADNDKQYKRAASVQLDYKGADPEEKGSFGLFAAYRYLGEAAVIAPTYSLIEAGLRGYEVGMDYALFKNVVGSVQYFDGKNIVNQDNKESRILGKVEVSF